MPQDASSFLRLYENLNTFLFINCMKHKITFGDNFFETCLKLVEENIEKKWLNEINQIIENCKNFSMILT